jgi:MFS family permease
MPSDTPATPFGRPLRTVYYAWLFGAFWANIVGGAALNRFARSLGATDAAFGLLAAIPYLGAAVQLPIGYLVERGGQRKRWFVVGGLLDRLTWILIAAVPWVLPREVWWQAFLLGYAVAVVGANIDGPCWISWMADLVPRRIRGRFIAARSRLGQLMTLLLPVPIGWLLDHYAPMGDAYVRLAASGLLALAGLVGTVDILMHLSVPAAAPPPAAAVPSFGAMVAQPLRDANFRRFLGFNATLIFAVGFLGQYLWLYCFDVLGASTLHASVMLIILPVSVSFLCTTFYGPLIDKLGRKPLMIIGGLLILPGSIGWVFMSPGHWFPGYLCILISMLGWPAVETGRLNVLLSIGGSRAERGGGMAYVAVNSAVVAASGALSGFFGGSLAHALGPQWRGHFLGWPVTYHGLLFLISTVLRLAALLWLVRFHEPRAQATRDAIQYAAAAMVNSLQMVAAVPFRFLRRFGSAAFKVGRRQSRRPGGEP